MNYERSTAPLALMEQIIMILVFALASAVCLQAFVYSDKLSGDGAKMETATTRAQTVAEHCKAYHGDLEKVCGLIQGEMDDGKMVVSYPDDNLQVELQITASSGLFEKARIEVWENTSGESKIATDDGEPIYSIDVAWQKGGRQE